MIIKLFNFNKCCIWIECDNAYQLSNGNLTLTSVVFESEKLDGSSITFWYLTLTSVVFELAYLEVFLTYLILI